MEIVDHDGAIEEERSRPVGEPIPPHLVEVAFPLDLAAQLQQILLALQSRTSSFSASSTTAFFVRRPLSASASFITSSSISMFVRIGHPMCMKFVHSA